MTISYHFSVWRKLCPFYCQCIQVQKAAKHQNFQISCQYYRVVIQRTSYMSDLIQAIHSVSCSYDYVWQSVITLSIQVTTTRGIGHCSPPSRKTAPSCYHRNFIDKSFSCCTKNHSTPSRCTVMHEHENTLLSFQLNTWMMTRFFKTAIQVGNG